MFTADQIWSAAIAAQRINGQYLADDDHWSCSSPRLSNNHLIKQWLYEQSIPSTTEDTNLGILCRDHFKTYLFLEISGSITAFQKLALKIAHMDAFTNQDLFEFSVVACLPSVQERDIIRQSDIHIDIPDKVGDSIKGTILVVSSWFNPNYHKYRVTALLGDKLVEFWYRNTLAGECYIEAKIKSVNADYSTQLNHIKQLTKS